MVTTALEDLFDAHDLTDREKERLATLATLIRNLMQDMIAAVREPASYVEPFDPEPLRKHRRS